MLEKNQQRLDKLLPDYRVRPSLLRPILQFQGFDSGISAVLYGNQINLKIKYGFEKAVLESITEVLRALYALDEDVEFNKEPLVDFLRGMRDTIEEKQAKHSL